MQISVSDAKTHLTDLVRRAEAGDDVILTRRGEPTVRLVPVGRAPSVDQRRALLTALHGAARHSAGPDAAHSADFLYDDRGVPA